MSLRALRSAPQTCSSSSRRRRRYLHTTTFSSPPPTPAQLAHATSLYTSHPPHLLTSTPHFRSVPLPQPLPELAFLGRSNVGKSSLLNALFGLSASAKNKNGAGGGCRVSSKPGRTREMNFWRIGGGGGGGGGGEGNGGLVVVDMPGYGKGSREEWGVEIEKYLGGRKQLKRAFLLIDALHGPKPTDLQVLALFRRLGLSHQVILSKADRITPSSPSSSSSSSKSQPNRPGRRVSELERIAANLRGKIQPGLGDGPEAVGEMIACSAAPGFGGRPFGVEEMRWATLVAAGLGGRVGRRLEEVVVVQGRGDGAEAGEGRVVSEEELIVREGG